MAQILNQLINLLAQVGIKREVLGLHGGLQIGVGNLNMTAHDIDLSLKLLETRQIAILILSQRVLVDLVFTVEELWKILKDQLFPLFIYLNLIMVNKSNYKVMLLNWLALFGKEIEFLCLV